MTDTDSPCIVSRWIQAIRELRHWYACLDQVIQAQTFTVEEPPDQQPAIASLLRLRLEVETDLRKLLSTIPSNSEADPLNQLQVHTQTIQAWTRNVKGALDSSGFGRSL